MTLKKTDLTMSVLLVLSFFILLIEIITQPPMDFSCGSSLPLPPPEAIDRISPSSAVPGAKFVLTVILQEGFEPPPGLQITSITIGNISGKNIKRDGLFVINAEFTIPSSERPELKDVTVTFPGPFNSNIKLLRPLFFQVIKKVTIK